MLEELRWYLDAFRDLLSERTQQGLVPWSARMAYAAFLGLEGEERETFLMVLDALQGAYLEELVEAQKKAEKRR